VQLLFLITAHQHPELLARLCERILNVPETSVTVQWDRARPVPLETLPPQVELHRTQRPVGWATGTQLDALSESLAAVATRSFDWLLILSGQDYPIRPMQELTAFLEATPHQLFLQPYEGGTVPPPPKRRPLTHEQERYFYRYFWMPGRPWALLPPRLQHITAAGGERLLQALPTGGYVRIQRRTRGFSPAIAFRTRKHPFTPTRPCRMGADWFALSRPVYEDLETRTRAAPELLRYFRRTFHPTESFFHTVLLPSWESENAGTNLHYYHFSGGPHPDVLTESDYAQLRASSKFFARKFDLSSEALLDRIDRELLSL
jgi:hypothetical protein